MTRPRPFRFGVIVYQAKSKDEWVAKAQKRKLRPLTCFQVGALSWASALVGRNRSTNKPTSLLMEDIQSNSHEVVILT